MTEEAVPVYEYICKTCGSLSEEQKKISNRDSPSLCNCGGIPARTPSRTSFQLRGGGWYKDGYGGKGK